MVTFHYVSFTLELTFLPFFFSVSLSFPLLKQHKYRQEMDDEKTFIKGCINVWGYLRSLKGDREVEWRIRTCNQECVRRGQEEM